MTLKEFEKKNEIDNECQALLGIADIIEQLAVGIATECIFSDDKGLTLLSQMIKQRADKISSLIAED